MCVSVRCHILAIITATYRKTLFSKKKSVKCCQHLEYFHNRHKNTIGFANSYTFNFQAREFLWVISRVTQDYLENPPSSGELRFRFRC